MRTFGSLKARYQDFLAAGGQLRKASKFANVIHPSLIIEADDKLVLDQLPPPELHLMMGGVNCHMNLLIKMKGLPFIEAWTRTMRILRHGYQGGGYDGNNSKKILESLDDLAIRVPISCLPIISSLQALKAVISG